MSGSKHAGEARHHATLFLPLGNPEISRKPTILSDRHQSSEGLGRSSVNRREARVPAARKSAGKKADVVLPIYQGNGSNIKALGLQKRVATRRERLSFLKLFSAGIWGLMATSAINNFYFRKLICHVVIHFL